MKSSIWQFMLWQKTATIQQAIKASQHTCNTRHVCVWRRIEGRWRLRSRSWGCLAEFKMVDSTARGEKPKGQRDLPLEKMASVCSCGLVRKKKGACKTQEGRFYSPQRDMVNSLLLPHSNRAGELAFVRPDTGFLTGKGQFMGYVQWGK